MRSLPLPLVILLAAACNDPGLDTAYGLPGDVIFEQPEFVVVANNTACLTNPCPSLTVIGPTGDVSQIADVVLPTGEELAMEHVYAAGLRLKGVVVLGDWSPGAEGDAFFADSVGEPVGQAAPFFNGVVCFTAPCPSTTVLEEDGSFSQVSGIDLSALDLLPEDADSFRGELYEGRLLVGGFVRSGSWDIGAAGDIFVVTRYGSINDDYAVSYSGITCNSAPCPNYSAVDSNGDSQLIDSINLDGQELSEEARAELFAELDDGDIELRGFINAVVTEGPNALVIDTLHVTRILQSAE